MINKDGFVRWATSKLRVPNLEVEVGFLDNATYISEDEESTGSDEVVYVAKVAYDNNYGNGVPARPFFTNIVDTQENEYYDVFKKYIDENYPVGDALGLVGMKIKQDIQKEIIDLKEPPNSPATIARKKSSNPLVDTGHMGDSVTYKVRGIA